MLAQGWLKFSRVGRWAFAFVARAGGARGGTGRRGPPLGAAVSQPRSGVQCRRQGKGKKGQANPLETCAGFSWTVNTDVETDTAIESEMSQSAERDAKLPRREEYVTMDALQHLLRSELAYDGGRRGECRLGYSEGSSCLG